MRPSLKQTSTHPEQLKGPAQGSGLKGPRVQRTRARSFWMPPWDHARALHARQSRRCQHHNIIQCGLVLPLASRARACSEETNPCVVLLIQRLCCVRIDVCTGVDYRVPAENPLPSGPAWSVNRVGVCAHPDPPRSRHPHQSPRSSLTGDWCLSRRREVSYRLSRNSTASVAVSPRKQTGEALTPSSEASR